ncbi:MAG: DUF2961 domain-containing protein [Pirellulales bacterium]|nr:DUF2961 domain-containing protein [Pirellulales bacterium]
MASTWDRKGGNDDGNDFKDFRPAAANEPARNVLLDVEGPGCIHRIFAGVVFPQHAGTRIRIFLDAAKKPLFDMPITEFFDYKNGPIPYPLVFHKSYPGTLFPIPFAKHCRVQLVNDQYGKPDWNDALWSNYWQIAYTRYPASTPVKSLAWPLDESEKAELEETCRAWLKAESGPPAEPKKWAVEKSAPLDADEELLFRIPGRGVIRQMRLQVDPATPDALGNLRMRIVWDGAKSPGVEVPVGFFFGNMYGGYGKILQSPAAVVDKDEPLNLRPKPVEYDTRFNSLLLGVAEAESYCRFPMPFDKGAVLAFTNAGKEPIKSLRLRLDVERLNSIPKNWGRFQTAFRQCKAATAATPGVGPQKVPAMEVLNQKGRGKYVGVMLSVDWPLLKWWGEGDWLIWTDQNAWPPDYHGTGSEEYFNSGWCRFDRKAVSGFVTLRPGHPTVYSFHLNDAFQFQKNIRVVEEQMGDQYIQEAHPLWTATAYWYGQPESSE